MERVNLQGGRPWTQKSKVRMLQPFDFQAKIKEGLVIDCRSPEVFAGEHIPLSYNIWLQGLPAFAGWVADESAVLFLVLDEPQHIHEAVTSLARIGIDRVEGVLAGGIEAWQNQGFPIEMMHTISAQHCSESLKQKRMHVLDVRDDNEREGKRIPGSLHTYVGCLEENLPQLPKEEELVVHCSVGHRGGLAASILKRNGFTNVYNLLGGIQAWEALNLPLDKPNNNKS
jgi:hydroxyacylglutathione hydrolase